MVKNLLLRICASWFLIVFAFGRPCSVTVAADGADTGLSNGPSDRPQSNDRRPNILFCIADDWSWPHAGVYGDRVVKTPTFDRIARHDRNARKNNSCLNSHSRKLCKRWK